MKKTKVRKALPKRQTDEPNPAAARAAILEAVENQLRELAPPEVQQTYERLIGQGYSDIAAKELIAVALSNEIFSVMKEQQPYNETRYTQTLAKLPRMPWD